MSTPSPDPEASELVTAGDVEATRDRVLGFLRPLRGMDWRAPVPDLEWNCDDTLRHMISAQLWYAGHLASRSTRRLALPRSLDPGLDVDGLLDNLEAQASILAAVIRDAAPETRTWHNSGMTDRTGYIAMACSELLVHTWDIGRGLGVPFGLARELSERVVRACSRCGRRSTPLRRKPSSGATAGSRSRTGRASVPTGDGGRGLSTSGTAATRTLSGRVSQLSS